MPRSPRLSRLTQRLQVLSEQLAPLPTELDQPLAPASWMHRTPRAIAELMVTWEQVGNWDRITFDTLEKWGDDTQQQWIWYQQWRNAGRLPLAGWPFGELAKEIAVMLKRLPHASALYASLSDEDIEAFRDVGHALLRGIPLTEEQQAIEAKWRRLEDDFFSKAAEIDS